MRRLAALLLPLVFLAACSEPPNKELDRAGGAIDAARAAGAEQYAPEAYAAATNALSQANAAVAQGDYRLALTRALDAYGRAQEAARGAADGKARARSAADAAVLAADAALTKFEARLFAMTPKLTRREVEDVRKAHSELESALQKARAALSTGGYVEAKTAADDVTARIAAQMKALETAATAKPTKPKPRRR